MAAPTEPDMKLDPQRARQLVDNITTITSRIQRANTANRPIRLIAVSKLKPATDILALHQPPTTHLHFGENYTQELHTKATLLPRSIRWHFIGALQSNKCKQLAAIPNLWCVSSVDSIKKADGLEKGRRELLENKQPKDDDKDSEEAEPPGPLRVMVQINTSGEESKSGVEPAEALALCRHIRAQCPHLRLTGLMTVGAIARSQATTAENENEDFVALVEVRDKVAKELGLEEGELELSMGMSADFEGAIRGGSDEVRVGSEIFGTRPPKGEAVV
ncbi:alanine racemase family protein [Lophium mytilinum]|uniref:Pyridoxal phosphate homeostasis protein n=1 Tax=Lophium mytilinum TaxID=390894 RepID=A0A6A6R736_9PEZI|nr:alanine racemase family protein [Lophium mytilinum]